MDVRFESKDLPNKLKNLLHGTRVTMTLQFDVEEIHIVDGDDEYSISSIKGDVLSCEITHKQGHGGLDPVVENAIKDAQRMTARSMGSHG